VDVGVGWWKSVELDGNVWELLVTDGLRENGWKLVGMGGNMWR
jgi:hypothetical protein